jgi:hypothetical protein
MPPIDAISTRVPIRSGLFRGAQERRVV